jgi:hypothetical protein
VLDRSIDRVRFRKGEREGGRERERERGGVIISDKDMTIHGHL